MYTDVPPSEIRGSALDETPGEPPAPPGDRRCLERLPGGGFVYNLLDENVRIEARDLRRVSGGQLHAIVTVICQWSSVKNPVADAHYNLSSQTARNGMSKHCAGRTRHSDKSFNWNDAIDSACIAISQADRTGGEQAIVLDDAPEPNNLDFEVLGLYVPADAPSILIAHGDSMKSFIMLLILGTLAQRGHKVALLDWEWSASRHLGRKRRLFGPNRLPNLYHMNCKGRPLTIMRDHIARFCDTHKIDMLGLDSIGMACDGPLKDDDTAIRFHQALSTLPPTLCAAHVPKGSINAAPDEPITPFGSVFFSNLCRASWLVKKQTTQTPDLVSVNLYAGKQNEGKRRSDVGMQFDFTEERIFVRSVEPLARGASGGSRQLPARIEHALRTGSKTYAQLAKELGAKEDSVIKAVTRGMNGKNPRWTRLPGIGADNVYRIELLNRVRDNTEAEV